MADNESRLTKENTELFFKLEGVMHSVDKWLDGDELKQDEVNRAATMREKTLLTVEAKQVEIERLQSLVESKRTEIERLKKERRLNLLTQLPIARKIKSEAIKEFAEKLCEGRVSNDPVVIAVKAELKLTEGCENG